VATSPKGSSSDKTGTRGRVCIDRRRRRLRSAGHGDKRCAGGAKTAVEQAPGENCARAFGHEKDLEERRKLKADLPQMTGMYH
jgi:hypothetical protein